MLRKEITMECDITGRRAANFVYAITSKPYEIWVVKNDTQVNGKNIIGLLSANISDGDVVTIVVNTNDKSELNYIIKTINE